jgi:hypothetical protein
VREILPPADNLGVITRKTTPLTNESRHDRDRDSSPARRGVSRDAKGADTSLFAVARFAVVVTAGLLCALPFLPGEAARWAVCALFVFGPFAAVTFWVNLGRWLSSPADPNPAWELRDEDEADEAGAVNPRR